MTPLPVPGAAGTPTASSGGSPTGLTVTEFTDPLCPWAWGSEPTLRALRRVLGEQASWRRVFGILFDEDDDPPPDPAAETRWYEGFVAEVCGHTGAPRADRLDRVALSSWPSSLAAKAAEYQGGRVADLVLRRLRESVFVLGVPADTEARVLDVLAGVPGLAADRLLTGMRAAATRRAVARDRAETRRPARELLTLDGPGPHSGRPKPVEGGHRYALPTVRLTGPQGTVYVPGWRPYEEYLAAARAVAPGVVTRAAPLTAAQALERYRSVTAAEVKRLTGAAGPPAGAVRVETPNCPLWLHPEEARAHPAAVRPGVMGISPHETSRGIH